MPDTPTPAPLTDEQIDRRTAAIRGGYVRGNVSYGMSAEGAAMRDATLRAEFDTWLAAVIARAKREAAEEIAQEIDRLHDTVYQARRVPELDPLRVDTACQAYRDGATIARRIGGDHA